MSTMTDDCRQYVERLRARVGRIPRYRHPRTSYHATALERGVADMDLYPMERILSSIVNPETGCWEWPYATTIGYGRIKVNGRIEMAHRVSYRIFVGPLRRGFCIDHQCMNKACVNPDHLEQVTYSVNMRRAYLAKDAATKRQAVS